MQRLVTTAKDIFNAKYLKLLYGLKSQHCKKKDEFCNFNYTLQIWLELKRRFTVLNMKDTILWYVSPRSQSMEAVGSSEISARNYVALHSVSVYLNAAMFVTQLRRFTYLLTPWSRVLLEKLTGLQLVKKFPAFYGTRRFITALTSARHLSFHVSVAPAAWCFP
jgi:hypothetical protein